MYKLFLFLCHTSKGLMNIPILLIALLLLVMTSWLVTCKKEKETYDLDLLKALNPMTFINGFKDSVINPIRSRVSSALTEIENAAKNA